MKRVVHFEIHSDDPATTHDFFHQVFGWEFQSWDGPEEYWLTHTGPSDETGINGGLMRSSDGSPRTVNTIQVPSVDKFTEKIENYGGKIVNPKVTIPKVGYVAYCEDPRGVLFGIFQDDPTAN